MNLEQRLREQLGYLNNCTEQQRENKDDFILSLVSTLIRIDEIIGGKRELSIGVLGYPEYHKDIRERICSDS